MDQPKHVESDPARAPDRAWTVARVREVPCPVDGCGLRHDYESWLTHHGYGSPPLHLAAIVREQLRSDLAYQEWVAQEIAGAIRLNIGQRRAMKERAAQRSQTKKHQAA